MQKTLRYMAGSAAVFVFSEAVLVVLLALSWSAVAASVAACVAGGVPGYFINRNWVWRQSGPSHLWREVVPFWASAFVGLVVTTVAADVAESWAHTNVDAHAAQVLVIAAAAAVATGAVWVGKFALFNWVLFNSAADEAA